MQTPKTGPSTPPNFSSSGVPHARSASLWFDDGNVVLQTHTTQYRVHRNVLGSHSLAFRAMFRVPPPESQNTLDGCPVVRVTDSAQDWDALLAVMYGHQQMTDPTHGVIPFTTLRAALVLGSKYKFEWYKLAALEQLEKLYPPSLAAWHATLVFRLTQYGGKELELLELVLSFGSRTMLPSAYYSCISHRDLDDIVHEYRQDRDRPIPFDSLNRIICSQKMMSNILYDNVLRWCWDGTIPSANCMDTTHCSQILFPFFRHVMKSPQNLLHPFQYSGCASINLCPACKEVAAAEYEKGCQLAWIRLPELFGLGE